MARKEMSESKLASILDQAISESEHVTDGVLSKEREKVTKYYRGELPKQAHSGDSKYVSRDVFDTVDSMRATILEGYSASSRIVYFRPENGETVEDAKQATEYCRHVFFKENDGEDVMYDTLTEGLQKRHAVVKVYGEELSEEDEYEFEGMTAEEITLELEEYPNYEFQEVEVSDAGLYSGSFTVTRKDKSIKTELIQPEDLLISSQSANISDARYAIHRMTKTKSDLLKEGFDKKLVNKIVFAENTDFHNIDKINRWDGISSAGWNDHAYDEAGEDINLYEVYIKIDLDGSHVQKLWKICYAGGVILEKEQVARMPFASFVPLPIPHTYLGENFASAVIPTQDTRTILIRQIVNHSRITNNPRTQVLNGTVKNPRELLDNRLGGIVNVRRMDGLAPIPQAPLNPYVFNLIGMIDEDKEETTGISKLSQGMNKDAISTQNAEGMVENLISASQQRQKIIARRFGKFVRDLYHLIYMTAADFIDEEVFVEVTGNYIPVNPSAWEERTPASIELTLSYAELEKEAQKWTEIDQYFSQDPVLAAQYTPDKRYEVISRALEKRGIEDVRSLLTPPEEMEPQEPSMAEKLEMEETQSRIAYQNAQAKAMVMKAETDRMNAETAYLKAKAEAENTRNETRIDSARLSHDREIDLEELKLAKSTPKDKQSASFAPNN